MGLFGISTNCPSFGLDLGRGHAGNCKGRKRKCFFHEGRKEQLPFVFSSRSTLEKALLHISFSQSFHPGHKPQTKLYCCRYTSHWGITSQLALDKGFHELNTSEILKTEGAEIQIQGWTWQTRHLTQLQAHLYYYKHTEYDAVLVWPFHLFPLWFPQNLLLTCVLQLSQSLFVPFEGILGRALMENKDLLGKHYPQAHSLCRCKHCYR